MTTWITEKNNKVGRIRQTPDAVSPGPEWFKVPNDWGGNPEDDLSWLDVDMRRIPDAKLVEMGKRKDNRGRWFNKKTFGESKVIAVLDESPGEDWTREIPMENEPHQKWDDVSSTWIVDTEAKEKAEKERLVAEKQAAILEAEKNIQRSTIAKLAGTATQEDEEFFNQFVAEIAALREELRELTAA